MYVHVLISFVNNVLLVRLPVYISKICCLHYGPLHIFCLHATERTEFVSYVDKEISQSHPKCCVFFLGGGGGFMVPCELGTEKSLNFFFM